MRAKNEWIVVAVFLLVFFSAATTLFSAEDWWNENWEYRLGLTLKNPTELNLETVPILINGEILRKKTGLLKEKISTLSIRIIDGKGEEVPVQVDEKDGTGLFQGEGNGQLDGDDEIVFQVSLKPQEQKKFLLYFRKKFAPLPEYPTDLRFEKTSFGERRINYNVRLSNSAVSIGIRGAGTEKDEKGKLLFGGAGKASITSFKIKGEELVYQSHALNWNLGSGGYSLTSKHLPWSQPELIVDGPVRKIVVCRAPNQDRNFTEEFKMSWALSGKIKGDYYRYFILYSQIPFAQMIETIKIENADSKYRSLYEFAWCPAYPRDWDNDKLYVPVGGTAVTIGFADERDYSTKEPGEGWLGIVNPPAKKGLAVFFDKDGVVDVSAGFYASHMKRKDILENEWSRKYTHTSVRITYGYEDFNLYPLRENRFGFYGVTLENAETLSQLYQVLWKGLVAADIAFGFPEEKPGK